MTYSELKKKYQNKTVAEGWFLLTAADALELITFGLNEKMELGIVEGFLKSPEGHLNLGRSIVVTSL